ncbi:MAG TPA: NAD(P)-binding domain-containing protein [Actinophytocola sp.]|jgi:pyrroline-5-carboxylate reductase|nr:NAD(P)-binding domain-containing protein [Actinophytocola sp.]
MRYGFVGAGAITAAIVEGVSAGVAEPPGILLSPRGRSAELAGRFANVRVCGSNQDVVDGAAAVVLAVRPPDGRAVLEELALRPGHVVISALAGVGLASLREWAAPAHVVRSIPLPQAARARSLTVMYPDHAAARELFERAGGVIVPDEEKTLDAFSAATATFAAHLDSLGTIAGWMAGHGVDPDAANAYVAHVFGQLGESLLRQTGSLAALTEEHMTPGGINEQVLADLRRDGVPDVVRRALDRVLARLRR